MQLFRLIFVYSPIVQNFIQSEFVIVCLLGTLLFGSTGGFSSLELGKVFAFSSIHHFGFILMIIRGTADYSMIPFIFYLFIYFISAIGFLNSLGVNLINNVKLIGFNFNLEKMLKFLFFSLSLAGIPPGIGFLGKIYAWSLIFSVLKLGWSLEVLLALFVSLLTTLVAGFYYIRFVKVLLVDNNSRSGAVGRQKLGIVQRIGY